MVAMLSTLLFLGLTTLVQGQLEVPPCGALLSHVIFTAEGDFSAVLSVPVPDLPHAGSVEGWHLRLTFVQPVENFSHNATGAMMSTIDDRNFIVRHRSASAGPSLVLELRAHSPGPAPRVAAVKYNNVLVCNVTLLPAVNAPPCTDLLDSVTANVQGEWSAVLSLPIPDLPHASPVQGWHLRLSFSHPVAVLTHNATGTRMTTVDDRHFIVRSPLDAERGRNLTVKLHAQHAAPSLALAAVKFNNLLLCNGSRKFDYAEVLSFSLLFLEAQQSGPLPPDKRVAWRGDSCMKDRGKHGEDLTGGYFTGTAGRTVKFTFPNAAANTMLAWGLTAHEGAYKAAGELINAMAAVDWGARYLAKCHTASDDVYAVVGDQLREGSELFARPEDVNYPRPTLALSPDNPGSDLFGEMVAALAASSVALRDHWDGPQVSAALLYHARRLFELAAENRGDYLRAMQILTGYQVHVPRNGDECELIWAAVWMYRATAEERYLQLAQKFYKKLNFRQRPFTYFYWDDKAVGAQILLYQMTRDELYASDARIFCDTVAFNASMHTPQGLLRGLPQFASGMHLGVWAAFACTELGEAMRLYGSSPDNPYVEFALRQVHLALGDSGRSYVVGWGHNPPIRPNHMASLCGPAPSPCSRELLMSDAVNYHVLRGALVRGPDDEGRYEDSRRGLHNHVDVVANAGLASALAALIDLRSARFIP